MHEDWTGLEGHVGAYIAQKLFIKTAQLGHTAGKVEVQPLSPSLTFLLNLNPGTNVLCVLYSNGPFRTYAILILTPNPKPQLNPNSGSLE